MVYQYNGYFSSNENNEAELPGDPGVKTKFAMQGCGVQSPVGELRAHIQCGAKKKKNFKKEKNEVYHG